jgi:hypothetical protein
MGMNEQDLDHTYTALCQAMAEVGEQRAPLFLSMVCLALISRMDRAEQVMPLIVSAQKACRDDPAPT